MKQFIRTTTQFSLRLLVLAGLLASMLAGVRTDVAGATSAGMVIAWGYGEYGQTNVPAGLTEVIAVAGARFHSLALKSDGTVVGWGCGLLPTNYGQCAGQTGAIAIAANGYHSLALRSDGMVVAWGNNAQGQTNLPFGLTGVTAIAAGLWHNLALKSDGTVVAWGGNSDGQRTVPAGLTGVTAIAAGDSHSLALKNDGTVVAWGGNLYGQRTVPAGLTDVTAIAAGGYHNLALKSDGTVVAWGANFSGQSTIPAGLTGVIAIAAGSSHSLALKGDGTVVAWGDNGNGQTAIPAGLTDVMAIGSGELHSLAIIQTGPEPCPAGQYDNGNGCVDASPGYYVPVAGSAEQMPCAVGTYQPNAGSVSCMLASPGYYVDVIGASQQIACPAGSTSESGASACTLITSPITIISGGGSGEVGTPDPLITYSIPSGDSGPAVIMPTFTTYATIPGTRWVNTSGLSGFTAPDQGSSQTTTYTAHFTLPEGFVSPAITIQVLADNEAIVSLNGTEIGRQPHFTFSGPEVVNFQTISTFPWSTSSDFVVGLNTLSIVNIDYDQPNGVNFKAVITYDTAPDPCSPGSYDNGSGCVNADPGHYVPVSGATEQTPCAPGTYQPNTGSVSCLPASPGHYVDVTAAAIQIDCLSGSYQPNSEAVSCILASPNYYVPVSAAIEQIACPVGYTSEAGATECTPAPDVTAPTIALTTPANDATYLLNQSIIADYTCQDEAGGSGLASCVGTLASGSAIDTSSAGVKSFAVNATDHAGNPASTSVSYSVVYNFSGFSSPVDIGPTLNVAKAGQAIPLKWRITDANGAPVTNLSNVDVTVASLSCGLGTTTDALEEYASGSSGLQNLGNGYYQFNWRTPRTYENSCKTLKLSLGEGTGFEHTALFKFTR